MLLLRSQLSLSAAKGLCHGLEIPLIGIPSLEALASQIPYSDLPIAPILYSRKRELYTAQFIQNNGHSLTRSMDDMAFMIDDLPSIFPRPSLFIGNNFQDQSQMLQKALGSLAHFAPPIYWSLKASSVGALGLTRFKNNDLDDPLTLEPIYLRPPEIRHSPFLTV